MLKILLLQKCSFFQKRTPKTPATPFRRVPSEDIEVDPRLSNNSFEAKVSMLCVITGVNLNNIAFPPPR